MKYFIRVIVSFILLLLVTWLGQYMFNYMYYWFPQNSGSSWIGGDDAAWAHLFGLTLSFYFFLSLLIVLFFDKYKYYLLPIVIILLFPILRMFYPDWSFMGTYIGVSIAGWILGEGILWSYNKLKK